MWGPYSRQPYSRKYTVTVLSIARVRITAEGGGFASDEILYFIEEPTIRTQGVIATHVTVKSPTHEHTASIPATPAENTIERVIEIKEGNAEICQTVAEQLLERWGEEQISIVGRVQLMVVLRFKEYVRVKIPSVNIDDEYILQRKEHDLSTFETQLTVGDIIVGDNELLARILEELEVA